MTRGVTVDRRGAPSLHDMLRASDGILDLLPIATFICDAKGTILQYNRHAVAIWGRTPKPDQTHADFTKGYRFFSLAGEELTRSVLSGVLETGTPVANHEVVIERGNGERVPVSLSIDPLRDAGGTVIGAVNCFVDITDRQRVDLALEATRRDLREQQQRLAATYEHAAIGISEVSAEGIFLRVNEAICDITGRHRDELLATRLFTNTHPDDTDTDREAFLAQVQGRNEFYAIEKRFVRPDGRVIWMAVRSSPVRDPEGRFLFAVRVVQDITERKAADERQKLLIDELNHRVKNTLATVQSLAAQSARGSPSPDDFRRRFEGRLMALSKAHNQLTLQHWEHANLRDILNGSLAPYKNPEQPRAILSGEPILLRPRAALTLAMIVHELTTNAVKYGALSQPSGMIALNWHVTRNALGHPTDLQLDWREHGGPVVEAPTRRGFGSILIEGSVKAELGGTATLDYRADGLHCAICFPLADTDEAEPVNAQA